MSNPIHFFSKSQAHFWLSNFAPYGFEGDGVYWPTVEHYFQAQKFDDVGHRERIRLAGSPKQAKALGRSRAVKIRPDWDTARDEVMLHALRLKFRNPELRGRLLRTGRRKLIEKSPYDNYWGCGRSGRGRNRLGELLMQVREELRGA